ncbi:MAG: glycosyltransferase family A protein [Desulfocapsaceae bacterium]|nr:glycosyltransferase family A protein [Desulfocapsaceae bacterium]
MDKVSVILPTYNRASLVSRAISSILRQGDLLGELIIVDDGSDDDTEVIIGTHFNYDNIVYTRTENQGPGAARNTGVDLARFPLIAFLDSDDHWQPDKLNKQLRVMKDNPHYSISHTEEKWYRRGKHLNKRNIHHPRHGNIFSHCLKLCAVGMSTVIMSKELFCKSGGFDETMPCCEDYDLWLRLSWQCEFLLVPEALTIKEGGRVDQLSWQYRVGMDKYRIYALEKLIQNATLSDVQLNLAINELKEKCRIYGNGCIKHGKKESGYQYLAIPEKYKCKL